MEYLLSFAFGILGSSESNLFTLLLFSFFELLLILQFLGVNPESIKSIFEGMGIRNSWPSLPVDRLRIFPLLWWGFSQCFHHRSADDGCFPKAGTTHKGRTRATENYLGNPLAHISLLPWRKLWNDCSCFSRSSWFREFIDVSDPSNSSRYDHYHRRNHFPCLPEKWFQKKGIETEFPHSLPNRFFYAGSYWKYPHLANLERWKYFHSFLCCGFRFPPIIMVIVMSAQRPIQIIMTPNTGERSSPFHSFLQAGWFLSSCHFLWWRFRVSLLSFLWALILLGCNLKWSRTQDFNQQRPTIEHLSQYSILLLIVVF